MNNILITQYMNNNYKFGFKYFNYDQNGIMILGIDIVSTSQPAVLFTECHSVILIFFNFLFTWYCN